MYTPLEALLPYQRRWIEDESRFKMGLWSRQSGKSTACAAEVVRDALRVPGTTWVLASAGERQALELMEKVRTWSDAFNTSLADYAEERRAGEALLKRAEATWPNGSRVLALPANAKTIRGYSANVVLDEFAFYEDAEALWRALYPAITSPFGRGGRKKLRIVTTPNGPGNKAHELWTGGAAEFSRHKVTIYDAVAQGLEIDVEALRRGLGDPEGWAQEFECQFLDSRRVLLPYELIAKCEHASAAVTGIDWANPPRGRHLYLGLDFARRQDLSVLWVLEEFRGCLWTREVLCMAGLSSPEQAAEIRRRLRGARRLCLDSTGPGTGLADWLISEFGELDKGGKVDACHFTLPFKRELFGTLRLAFERELVRVPVNREVREDLHLWTRGVTRGGEVTYTAPHAVTEGGQRTHGDRAVALALALRASGGVVTRPEENATGCNWQPVAGLRQETAFNSKSPNRERGHSCPRQRARRVRNRPCK
jgi:phage FluMu gp28-like protein